MQDSGLLGQPPHVAVDGVGRLEVIPDRAVVRFSFTAVEGNRPKAHDAVAQRVAGLRAILDREQIGEDQRQTSAVYVVELRDRDRNQNLRKVSGYQATASTSVRFRHGQPIGEVIGEAVREAGADIGGPHWYVSSGHPAQLEVYRLAALDARSKAQAVAAGLGVAVGDVLEAGTPGGQGFMGHAVRAAAAPMAAGQPPEIPVDPGEVTISATVRVAFAIAGGTSPG